MNKLITTIACLICCIVYTQAQNKNNMLSKKEQSIAAISMYAARGNQDSLKVILARGLDCGLTVSEEKEVLTQLYAYCGFPRSMGALVTLMNLTKERAAQGIKDEAGREPSPVKSSDMFVVGGQNQLKLFGRPALGEVLTFAPALDQFLKAHLFGDIFSRDNLDWRTRELSTVAALSVLDGVKNELNTHIAHAKHNGVTQAQIDEVLIMAARCRNGMVLSESDEPAKTFQTDPTITVRKVFYKNRYDIMLCAEMYLPKDFNEAQHYAALIIGHPFGAVKEQCSGLYAQEMARRGYVTLAFDASYQGESGGEPRHTVSPDALVEDFSASVDWLGLQPFIDRNRIGVIGICGSGGFSVCAASLDPRIKALATVSMYDMGRATRNGLGDSMTDEQRRKLLDEVAEQRWKEAETGEARIRFGTPEKLLGNANAVQKEFFDYYRNPLRGDHGSRSFFRPATHPGRVSALRYRRGGQLCGSSRNRSPQSRVPDKSDIRTSTDNFHPRQAPSHCPVLCFLLRCRSHTFFRCKTMHFPPDPARGSAFSDHRTVSTRRLAVRCPSSNRRRPALS